ncbi:DUF1062 domain-containing protein [Micromonospora citrea]|uniref:DUF1062 domain-containing protein n=1 Tax=Micromonospora citrea TaxID=47855 RepID=UPI003C607289
MSTRPHIVLPVRVDTHGELLDIRLLVACVPCNRTGTFTIHDRVPVRYLDPILLARSSGNCTALVARVRPDPMMARRNRFASDRDSCLELLAPPPPESRPVHVDDSVPPSLRTAHRPAIGPQPRGDRSPGHDRHSALNSQGDFVRPAMSRCGPEPGREARWPCPAPHHAAVRARSLMPGCERRPGPARYRRRR